MTLSPKGRSDKGKVGERGAAALIADLLGYPVRRTLAGHRTDHGDLSGLPNTTIQVKAMADTGRAIREGLRDLATQQANTGHPHAALFVRRPGGRYIVVLEPHQWAALWREATQPAPTISDKAEA